MRWPVVLQCVALANARADPPPLVLAPNQVAVRVVAEASLAPGGFARPLSLAPDAWVGVTPRLTIGVIHSDLSIDRLSPKASLCVRQDRLLCPRAYRGIGVDLRYAARLGPLAAVPHVRLLLRDVAPLKPAVTLGAAVRWARGRLAFTTDPFVQVGLANTDRGNRSALWIPVIATVSLFEAADLELHTGWNSDFAVIRDGWHVPAGLFARVRISPHVEATAGVGFTSLLGPQNTPKLRLAVVSIGWRS